MPLMNEVQFSFPSEPCKPLKLRSLYVVLLIDEDVCVERRRACYYLNHEEGPVAIVVAETEVEKAIDILKVALARPHDEYEDLGRVTDTLLKALRLQPGQFART
jgi:hypothetical protein